MIYAQLHTYNGNQVTIASRTDQPDATWIAYNVPSADWLYLLNGVITVHTQAEMDAATLKQTNSDNNEKLLEQIVQLEAKQARPLRELALGVSGALQRVQELDSQIAVLRKQLT